MIPTILAAVWWLVGGLVAAAIALAVLLVWALILSEGPGPGL
jgi:hypothetical protein